MKRKRTSNKLEITDEILDIVKQFDWFDKNIFKLFYIQKVSIQKLAKESGIATSSLYKTLKEINSKIIKNG